MAQRNPDLVFHLNLRFLKLLGIVPHESRSGWRNATVIFGSVFAFLFLVVPAICGLACRPDETDPQQRIGVITTQGEILFGLVKMTVLISKRHRITRLLQRREDLWKMIERENEFDRMERCLEQGRYVTCAYCANSLFVCIAIIVVPIFGDLEYNEYGIVTKSRELPMSAAMIHRNQTIYYIWYVLQLPTSLIASGLIVAIDTMIIMLISHATAHVKIIEFWLEEIGEFEAAKENVRIVDKISRNTAEQKKFLKCVHHHQDVLIYCQDLENVFKHVMLLQIVLRMSSGIVGIDLMKVNSDKIKRGSHLSAAVGVLLLHCWFPEQLRYESLAISQAVYATPWISWSPRDKKALCILMTRAQKPAVLTAGKFTVMSLSTFAEVMSKAMSFFALLRATT